MKIAIIGTGNLGLSIAKGLITNNLYTTLYLTKKKIEPIEKWKKYESMLDIPRNGKGFIAKTGITTGLDIYFGNQLKCIPFNI